MHSIYIFALLLSATNLRVFSVPLPLVEGDVVTYRGPKTEDVRKPQPHPAIVAGSRDGKMQDILLVSHKLPPDEYPHQVPTEQIVPGHFEAGSSISMVPMRVRASKLKKKGDKISDEVYAGIAAQMAECKSDHCNHVDPPKVKAPAQDPPKPAKLAPAIEGHPKADVLPVLVHQAPQRNKKEEPPRKVRKINEGPLKVNAEAARANPRPVKGNTKAAQVDTRPVKINAEPSRPHPRPAQIAEKPVKQLGQVKKLKKEAKQNVQSVPVRQPLQQNEQPELPPKARGKQKIADNEVIPQERVPKRKASSSLKKTPEPKKQKKNEENP